MVVVLFWLSVRVVVVLFWLSVQSHIHISGSLIYLKIDTPDVGVADSTPMLKIFLSDYCYQTMVYFLRLWVVLVVLMEQ